MDIKAKISKIVDKLSGAASALKNCFNPQRSGRKRKGESAMKSMTKRMLSLFLCACMMLAVFGCIVPQTGAASTSGSCGDNVTWSFNTSTGHLTIRGSGTMNDKNPWKTNYKSAIISVSIGNGVKNISEFAFYNCVNLKKASIGSSVEVIADRAFYNTNLESIAIPNSVLEIGECCFASCENLVSVDLPNKLKELDSYAFDGCKRLSSIDIPGTLKIIPSNCFRGNWALKKLVLPEGVEVIGSHAFSCGIETIQLPNTLKRINSYAFKGSAIREINIPASISIIEEFTFSQCHNLTQVTLPYSIKEVRSAAFKDCDNLKRVILPGYLTYIATDVFYFCEKLETVVFLNPDTVISEFCLNWVPYITGYAGSTAQTYAENRNLEFRPISYYDVMPWQWYYEATDYVTENGLMNGVATRKFDPESSMTRAMVVTVLWRYEGSPAAPSSTFSDVAEGTWYDQAVSWAAECGVVNGVGNNEFDPNGLVTREQIATIIYRYSLMNRINTAGREDLSTFPDDDKVSDWSYDAMSWAVAEGLIGGMTVGNGDEIYLKPEGNATRAQVATILMRFMQNVAGNKVAENIAMLGECGTIDD